MAIYIALLRGINVGGKNIIKMAELRKTLEQIGLLRVQTYIQSGNVLFESDADEESLRKLIENEIDRVFHISLAVILRTAEELNFIAANCPYTADEISEAESMSDAESLYVAFLPKEPSKESLARLEVFQTVDDQLRAKGREIYLLYRHSILKSKLANNLPKLDVPATVRNWKTLSKLVALANEMTATTQR
ncbi:DUF1697 domain-containing protein [Paenibacillus sp. CGMCC 1.16610]|uniref:DUF1697 domain-containing protein n=1 Tax=Paenibacillus anseongense TaxID=2682845 RepID=A0ABW9U5Z3_9BACL|nr:MULTISPECIES: DUF1697 domain-containing protein [Paenibacillus]MBA2938526.1 DUF1697 domain-containing protein [Paenibacillus sp. CGMCC 1.16610]MVQ35448.1 DUF1697 domain-containing protein [Paenibacillus anseongense]